MFLSVITQLQCSDHPLFSSLRNTYTFSWVYTFLTHYLALIFTLCAPFYLIYYVPSTTLHYCWRWLKDVSISALDNNSLMCNIELQQFRWDPETLSKYYIRYNNNTEPNGGEKVPKSLLRGLPEGNKVTLAAFRFSHLKTFSIASWNAWLHWALRVLEVKPMLRKPTEVRHVRHTQNSQHYPASIGDTSASSSVHMLKWSCSNMICIFA